MDSYELRLLSDCILSYGGEVSSVTHSMDTMILYKIQASSKQCYVVSSFQTPMIRRLHILSPETLILTPQWIYDSINYNSPQDVGFFYQPHVRLCFKGLIILLFCRQNWEKYRHLLEQCDAYVVKEIGRIRDVQIVSDRVESIPPEVMQWYTGSIVSLRWVDCCFQQGECLPFSAFVLYGCFLQQVRPIKTS